MPSSATITAFYSFTPNTRARATQVNNNFDNFRGHLVPIDPNTATAVDNTYDLGSSEYRWRRGHIKEVQLGVTSASWKIYDDTVTGGDLILSKNGTTYGKISTDGKLFPMRYTITNISQATVQTAGYTAITTLGFTGRGNPVNISLIPNSLTTGAATFSMVSNTTASGALEGELRFLRNGGQLAIFPLGGVNLIDNDSASNTFKIPVSTVNMIDFDATTGSSTYTLELRSLNPTFGYILLQNCRWVIREL